MNANSPFLSSQDLSTPRSVDSRKTVFKIFSDTLRPPSRAPENRRSVSRPNLSKVNKTSPRASAGGGNIKQSGFPSFHSARANIRQNHSQLLPNRTNRPSNEYSSFRNSKLRPNNRNLPGGGGGEGNYIERSHDPAQSGSGAASQGSPSMKDCHLNNVLRSARLCLSQLREAKENLSEIVAQDDQLARGIKKSNPTEDHVQLANVALTITNLCREAFVPAHRLNQTAIALHSAEDFLRYPSDIRNYNMQSKKRRIQLPEITFNSVTVSKLRQVVDLTASTYNKFNGKGRLGEELQEILFCVLRGYQYFYAAVLGCQEIFKVLLYAGQKEKVHLQQFLLALSAVERSDLLVEIQDLRRIVDEIVIFLEKLSWGSFAIYRLAGGENISSGSSATPSEDCFPAGRSSPVIPQYPAYPLLQPRLARKNKNPAEGPSNEADEFKQSLGK